MFRRVEEFHKAFGHLISKVPVLPNSNIRNLRISLLKEELEEFIEADEADDQVERADALADMCYIIAGTCVSYGIAPEKEFDYRYKNISQMDVFIHSYISTVLRKNFDFYLEAEKSNDIERIRSSLLHMMETIFGVSLHLGIPLHAVFTEVHRSNMSKLGPDGNPIYREDGKILKPKTFSAPDIASILSAANKTI